MANTDDKPKVVNIVTTFKPKQYSSPKVAFRNRSNFGIQIVFKEDDIFLYPNTSTAKNYLESDVVSVQDMSLSNAIAKGLVTVIR
jgi:hypothetical protein